MKLKIKVDDTTTVAELRLLGELFTGLAGERSYLPPVFVAPTDEAELPAVDPSPLYSEEHPPQPVVHVEATKRRRRTKAEIAAAEAAAVAVEAAAVAVVESEFKKEINAIEEAAKAEAGKDHPAPTPTATATDTPAASSSEGAAETPATESPSDTKTYTPAEVQKIAVATAGRFGPEKVKAIIAQYPGAARIADLPLTELAGFVAKLNAVS